MRILLILFIIFMCINAQAQPLQQVAHPPSTEVYDLLIDKKGFIWVAHALGVCRYDGISFTNFSHPAQTARSMTDLVEDDHGRI